MAVEVKVRPEVWHRSAAEELVSPTPFPKLSGVKDVTAEVQTGEIDGESLPVTRCLCGMEWHAWEGPILSVYGDDPYECPECHVKLFFSNAVTVYALAETVPLDKPEDPEYAVDIHGDLDVK